MSIPDWLFYSLGELSGPNRELDARICALLIGDGVKAHKKGLVIVPCSDDKNTCLIAPQITREIVKARKLMNAS